MNFYNDNESFACRWMQRLIDAGEIPEGTVSGKSITDITADEVRGYTQCHYFAGIAGWPLALRLAGVPADFPVWSGSVPCQGFSVAGKQEGFADERHLWPEFFRLISECLPPVILGEQVDAAIGFGWLDRVFLDLESAGYACGSIILPAASVGAPHQRHRIFWGAVRCGGITPSIRMADASSGRRGQDSGKMAGEKPEEEAKESIVGWTSFATIDSGPTGGMADTHSVIVPGVESAGEQPEYEQDSGMRGRLGNTDGVGRWSQGHGELQATWADWNGSIDAWSDYRIIPCRDGKHRRVGRCVQPLAARLPRSVGQVQSGLERVGRVAADLKESLRLAKQNRNGRLKGYGNAIVAPVAAVFIRAFLESITTCEYYAMRATVERLWR